MHFFVLNGFFTKNVRTSVNTVALDLNEEPVNRELNDSKGKNLNFLRCNWNVFNICSHLEVMLKILLIP